MKLVSHLVEIISRQGVLDPDTCQTCAMALATAEAEDALDIGPNVNVTTEGPPSIEATGPGSRAVDG